MAIGAASPAVADTSSEQLGLTGAQAGTQIARPQHRTPVDARIGPYIVHDQNGYTWFICPEPALPGDENLPLLHPSIGSELTF